MILNDVIPCITLDSRKLDIDDEMGPLHFKDKCAWISKHLSYVDRIL